MIGTKDIHTLRDIKKYIKNDLSYDMKNKFLECDNEKYLERLKHTSLYEGTIRAALWATLRDVLPINWFVQAECAYPDCKLHDDNIADVIVWKNKKTPIIFEVKSSKKGKFKGDRKKMRKHVKSKTSNVKHAYFVYPIHEKDKKSKIKDYRVKITKVSK